MGKNIYKIIIKITGAFVLLLSSLGSSAQTDVAFWFAAPDVTAGHSGANQRIYVVVTTFNTPAEVTIDMPANPGWTPLVENVPANTTRKIQLEAMNGSREFPTVENSPPNTVLNKGIYITSTEEITAYYSIETPNNPDIWALKGSNAEGREFYVAMQKHNGWDNYLGYNPDPHNGFIITATEDNTVVNITPTEDLVGHTAAAGTFQVTLQRGQTWVGMGASNRGERHPAGTKITSNKNIVVDVYDDSVKRDGYGCKDILGDQMVPTNLIGTEYMVFDGELYETANHDERFFVIATEDNTDIWVDGVFQATINETEVFEYDMGGQNRYVETSEPAYLYHGSGHGCEMAGAILPSISFCTGSFEIGFSRVNSRPFFLILMVKDGHEDAFLLDGNPVATSNFNTLPGNPDWQFAKIALHNTGSFAVGPHRIENTEDLFHMGFLNGSTNGGNSYGYFSNYNKLEIDAQAIRTETDQYVICYGDSAHLHALGGNNAQWSPDYNMDDPTALRPWVWPDSTTTYTVSVSGLCNMTGSDDVTVFVGEPVAAQFSTDRVEGCTPMNLTVHNTSYGNVNNQWYFSDYFLGTTSSNNPAEYFGHTFQNGALTPRQDTITLVVTNSVNCKDTAVSYVTTYPSVTASPFTFDPTTGCPPLTVNYWNLSTPAPASQHSHEWIFGDGTFATELEPTHTYGNPGPNDTTYNTLLVTRSVYNCRDTGTIAVTVHPDVQANFTRTITGNCTPITANFDNTSINGTQWTWDFGDGSPPLVTNQDTNVTHVYTNPGTSILYRTVTLTAEDVPSGCSDQITKVLPVYPDITAGFTTDINDGCGPITVNFTNTSVDPSIITAYQWNFKDGSYSSQIDPAHTFYNYTPSDTIYNVELVARTSTYCYDTATAPITVYPSATAGFAINYQNTCSPLEVVLDNTSSPGLKYHWDFDTASVDTLTTWQDSSITRTYTNTTGAPLTYGLKLIVSSSQCTDSVEKSLTIFPSPNVSFTADVDTGCNPLQVTFTNTSTGAISYEWTLGDGSNSTQPGPITRTYNNFSPVERTYWVSLTGYASANCYEKVTMPIVVYPFVDAAFTDVGTPGCSPYRAELHNSSTNASSFLWVFGDGDSLTKTITTPTLHTYYDSTAGTDTFNVMLYAANDYGCNDSATRPVMVYPQTRAGFTLTPTTGCNPLYVSFTNTSSASATSYHWDFGDGGTSTQANPEHLFENSTTANKSYNVTLTAISGGACTDQIVKTLTVKPYINADFTFSQGASCTPFQVDFRNNSTNGTYFEWIFGDGATTWQGGKSNASHFYDNNTAGTVDYQAVLVTTNADSSCVDSAFATISTYPSVDAGFSPGDTAACGPLPIQFTDTSSIATTSWQWDFGDGAHSTLQNPLHTFNNLTNNPVTYTVSMTASSAENCKDGASIDITVYPYVHAEFYTSQGSVCSPDTLELFNTSVNAVKYLWDFGRWADDTLTVFSTSTQDIYYVNNNATTDTITVSMWAWNSGGCVDSMKKQILVHPKIEVGFTMDDTLGCAPFSVNFTDTSGGAASYFWNFGDGGLSNQASPSHYFDNRSFTDTTYHVMMVGTSPQNCKDTAWGQVTLYPYIYADMVPDRTTGCNPLTVTIDDISAGADSVRWSFGDGASAYSQQGAQIAHTYTNLTAQPDTFYLDILSYNSTTSCIDSASQQIIVYPPVTANAVADNDTGCAQFTVNFDASASTGASSYLWLFGDGSYSPQVSPTHYYDNYNANDTTYTARLIATSSYFCTDTDQVAINVYPYIEAVASFNYTQGCSPFALDVRNNSYGASLYEWSFSHNPALDFTTTGTAQFYVSYTNPGTQPDTNGVQLVATSDIGCVDTFITNIIVWPQVTASFDFTAPNACSNESITFTNNSVSSTNWYWDFGDGSSSVQENPVHSYSHDAGSDSAFQVTLFAKSGYYCVDDTTRSLIVHPQVRADFGIAFSDNCAPFTPDSLVNYSGGATRYLWDFGRQADDTMTVFSTASLDTISFAGNTLGNTTYTISMTAIHGTNGCRDSVAQSFTVYPPVTAAFTKTQPDSCSGLTINFTNTSTNGVHYEWLFGDGSATAQTDPAHTFYNSNYTSDTTYTVRLVATSSQYCRDTASSAVYVHPGIDAIMTADDAFICPPSSPLLRVNTATGFDQLYLDYDDGFFTTGIAPTYNHYYSNTTTSNVVYTPKLRVSNTATGCKDSTTLDITAYPQVLPAFSFLPNDTACHNQTVQFDTTGTRNASSFAWDFGDGGSSVSASPWHLFKNNSTLNDTTYHIYLSATAANGCQGVVRDSVVILPGVNANFSLSKSGGCAPLPTYITDQSQGGYLYHWAFGDGNTLDTNVLLSSYLYTYLSQGNYSMSLTVENQAGCTDMMVRDVSVLTPAYARFTTPDPMQGCSPVSINFTNTSFPGGVTTQWEFGDGSSTNAASPGHTFTNLSPDNTASYFVTLTVYNSLGSYQCIDDTIVQVDVLPVPEANFTVDNSNICSPADVPFENLSLGADAATAYEWDFDGDGSYESNTTAANFTWPYTNTTSTTVVYNVELKAHSNEGCTDSITRALTVYPEVIAGISGTGTGCSPLRVNFTDNSVNVFANGTYDWLFSDDSTQVHTQDASHTFYHYGNTDTTFNVIHIATNLGGCDDTVSVPITVRGQPVAGFVASADSSCAPATISFTDQSTGASSYSWSFGDGNNSTDASPSHDYINLGSEAVDYQVMQVVSNGNNCSDNTVRTLRIFPVADASFTRTDLSCWPLELRFNTQDSIDYTYQWSFGDGDSAQGVNPIHVYRNYSGAARTDTVRLIATSSYGCTDTSAMAIYLPNMPQAAFTADPEEQMWPANQVGLDNQTTPGNWGFNWAMGDGQALTSQDPGTYTYSAPGRYEIVLTVTDSSGFCSDIARQDIRIFRPYTNAYFQLANDSGCPPITVSFANNSSYRDSSVWIIGDQTIRSDDSLITHTFDEPGDYAIKLTIYSYGTRDTYIDTVHVFDVPIIEFTTNPDPAILQATDGDVEFINYTDWGHLYWWDFGDGDSSREVNPTHTYSREGLYTVGLIAQSQDGCLDTLVKEGLVEVKSPCRLEFPNAFVPGSDANGGQYTYGSLDPDEINRVFYPRHEGIESYELIIFNKWGEAIYQSDDVNIGWDGFYNGLPAKQDVYVWKVKATCLNGKQLIKAGDVTILR